MPCCKWWPGYMHDRIKVHQLVQCTCMCLIENQRAQLFMEFIPCGMAPLGSSRGPTAEGGGGTLCGEHTIQGKLSQFYSDSNQAELISSVSQNAYTTLINWGRIGAHSHGQPSPRHNQQTLHTSDKWRTTNNHIDQWMKWFGVWELVGLIG